MDSYEDKIKWFCEKLFENIKMIFLFLSVLLIGVGLVGIEALSKRTNLPKEILAFVLVGLFAQAVLSIIDTLDQEKKTEPKKKSDFVYRNKEGHLVHYYPDGYDVVSKSENQFENSCETSYFVREKSTSPIQDAIEKDKESLDQILDENTSKEIIPDVNTLSRTTPHPTKNGSRNDETEAPRVNPILSDLINQIQTHGDNIVVKQQGQQLTIKATLNQSNQNKNNQWSES